MVATETKTYSDTLVAPWIHFHVFRSLPGRCVTFLLLYIVRAEIYRFSQRARKYQAAKVTRNFRSCSKVYRNVVNQLAPTRSMASFVLLQTVPERHVSASSVGCLGSKSEAGHVLDIGRVATHTLYTLRTLLSTGRELLGQWTGRTNFINGSAALFSIHLYTLNYEFQILLTVVI